MGDAGPPTPLPEGWVTVQHNGPTTQESRDVHVLVTGFGPFKSFADNPSWLIASTLSKQLSPLRPEDSEIPLQTKPSERPASSWFSKSQSAQQQEQDEQQPLRPPNDIPYRIHIHTYPSPVRVAYAPTSVLIPSLLNPSTNRPAFPNHLAGIDFDYILHIGLASGRDSYTIETIAHRNDYIIPDIDDADGILPGTKLWTQLGIPEELHVGWHPQDMLQRWQRDVDKRWTTLETEDIQQQAAQLEDPDPDPPSKTGDDHSSQPHHATAPDAAIDAGSNTMSANLRSWIASHGMLLRPPGPFSSQGSSTTKPSRTAKKPVVKLSRDAGRYLCEFILMCSLVYRYQESNRPKRPFQDGHEIFYPAEAEAEAKATHEIVGDNAAKEKQGKVAFLHVPNGTDKAEIERGVLVAESAIRAFVASWEDGWRNPLVYSPRTEAEEKTSDRATVTDPQSAPTVVGTGFESAGTGDR